MEDFIIVKRSILYTIVCTTLNREETQKRMTETELDITWTLASDEDVKEYSRGQNEKNGVQCEKYDDRKHYVFFC